MEILQKDGFDISDFVDSEKYVRIIETDHGVFLNGMRVPYVCRNSVKCKDDSSSIKTVSMKVITDSYIRLTGEASKAFEEKHGIKEKAEYTIW